MGSLEDLWILCLYKPLPPRLFLLLWILLQICGSSWLLPLSSRGFSLSVWPKKLLSFSAPLSAVLLHCNILSWDCVLFTKQGMGGKGRMTPSKVCHIYPVCILASPAYARVSLLIQSDFSFQSLAFGVFSA